MLHSRRSRSQDSAAQTARVGSQSSPKFVHTSSLWKLGGAYSGKMSRHSLSTLSPTQMILLWLMHQHMNKTAMAMRKEHKRTTRRRRRRCWRDATHQHLWQDLLDHMQPQPQPQLHPPTKKNCWRFVQGAAPGTYRFDKGQQEVPPGRE